MFSFDAFHLARIQFAFTASLHIIFPAITIGLVSYLVVLGGLWLKTKNPTWRSSYHFWSKIFTVNFGMGVVSRLAITYQPGTSWSGLSEFAGSITGSSLTYEVLAAFFLEAGSFGVMLFGWNRAGPGLYFFATCMVALGTTISTFQILVSDSWMQTPQGYKIVNDQAVPVDWFAVIFNPSPPYCLLHMSAATFLSSALFIVASGAWHLLRRNNTPAIRAMFLMAPWMTLIAAPLQTLIGDMHGLNMLKHQPVKIAAIEGHWENRPGESTPLLLFGWPDMEQERIRYGLEVPALGSLILTHSLDKQILALKEFLKEDRPNFIMVLWSLRIMAGLGMLMIPLGIFALWLRYKQRSLISRSFLCFALWMGPSGLIAIFAGWVTIEVGCQPWVIYGLQRTADAASAHGDLYMSISLLSFFVVHSSVFGMGYSYMIRLIRKGPQEDDPTIPPAGIPAWPLSAVVLDSQPEAYR